MNLNKALNHFPPALTATHTASFGQIALRLQGEPSQPYIVEASTDFTNWTSVTTNSTTSTATFTYNISDATTHFRFYRATLAP